MLFNNKEKEIEKLFYVHLEKVEACVNALIHLFTEYLKHDKEFKAESLKIFNFEKEADEVRDLILAKLHEGAFIPTNREDYVTLANIIDEIANKAQNLGNLIILTRPVIPEFIQKDIKLMLDVTDSTFSALKQVLVDLNSNIQNIHSDAQEVSLLESEIDKLEWNTIKMISKSDLDLACKLQLREIIQELASIADLAEDAADHFKLMAIKLTF